MKNAHNTNELLKTVEICVEEIGWQDYDCPNTGDTVESYADWCVGEKSDYWATINSADEKIRLNGWYVINGADYFSK